MIAVDLQLHDSLCVPRRMLFRRKKQKNVPVISRRFFFSRVRDTMRVYAKRMPLATFLPPTDKCDIKRVQKSDRQENLVSSWV
jgi:hypothetical protein